MIDNVKLSLEGQRASSALPLSYSNIDISTQKVGGKKVGGNYGRERGAGTKG